MTQEEIIEELNFFKKQPYRATNIEGVDISYGDRKYVRMKPKAQVTISSGLMHLILKKPKGWTIQNIKIEEEVTIVNETHKHMYYTLNEALFDPEEKEFKLHIKNGIDPNEDN